MCHLFLILFGPQPLLNIKSIINLCNAVLQVSSAGFRAKLLSVSIFATPLTIIFTAHTAKSLLKSRDIIKFGVTYC